MNCPRLTLLDLGVLRSGPKGVAAGGWACAFSVRWANALEFRIRHEVRRVFADAHNA